VAESGNSGGSGSDRYATSKANLRDSIKWLAGIFSALAAFIIAGTPLSGLGSPSLSTTQSIVGALSILVCFVCICLLIVLTLRLLRADLTYPSDINPSIDASTRDDANEIQQIRGEIARHKDDFIPEYANMSNFLGTLEAANKNAKDLQAKWDSLTGATPPDDAAIKKAREEYDDQVKQIQLFRNLQGNILTYASYLRLYLRIRHSTKWLLLLGIIALIALLVFTLTVKPQKEDKTPTVVVIPVSTPVEKAKPNDATEIGTVYFTTGSAEVTEDGRKLVERARNALVAKPEMAILLIARTDTVGPEKTNSQLARNRGEAVRNLLVKPGGIAASRVFSSEVPKSDLPKVTQDQQEVAANRSVSIYVIPFKR
jgi:outer membrane protein OmpA-like peptidoglycan-associated protein